MISSEDGNIRLAKSGRISSNFDFNFVSLIHLSKQHNKELLDSYNLIKQVEKLIKFDDVGGSYYLITNLKQSDSTNEKIITEETQLHIFLFCFHNSLIYVIIIVVCTITLLLIVHKCIKPFPQILNRKHHRVKFNTKTEDVYSIK